MWRIGWGRAVVDVPLTLTVTPFAHASIEANRPTHGRLWVFHERLTGDAPLWDLLPSWQAEPKKAWKALEKGDYDCAPHAMHYWPNRVKEKCKENKSYAVALGLA